MATTVKPKKITFKKAESEWYSYHETLKEIAALRQHIESPYDEDPEDPTIVKGATSVRQPGRPTEQIAIRLEAHKQLKYLTGVADTIGSVYDALPNDYQKLVKLRYWNHQRQLTWDQLAAELYVSERQARRWRTAIIQATIKALGWR